MERVFFLSSSRQRPRCRSSGRHSLFRHRCIILTRLFQFSLENYSFLLEMFVLTLQVYDKNLTSDDFMGSSTISLRNLELQK